MSAQDEMDRVILDLERQVDRLKAIRAQQLMQVTASPRVVAGPLRLVEETRVLTHPACVAPCGPCMDEPPGAA